MMDNKVLQRKLVRLAYEQGDKCAYCQERFGLWEDEANPTLDHVVPRSRGGGNTDANLVVACARCNTAKGSMSVEVFCKMVDEGGLRARKDFRDRASSRSIRKQQREELRAAVAAFEGMTPVKIGKPGAPFSKNKPLRRLYDLSLIGGEARDWDEDRFHRRPSASVGVLLNRTKGA